MQEFIEAFVNNKSILIKAIQQLKATISRIFTFEIQPRILLVAFHVSFAHAIER